MNYTLFTDVHTFYDNLAETLAQAQHSITLMYYTFDWGEWALKISSVLQSRQEDGVVVRILVDEIGLLADSPSHIVKNRLLMSEMSAAGIEVVLFRPQQRRTTHFNRLHFKLCAVDQTTVFVGGSNIGDEYLLMDDLNLRLDGIMDPKNWTTC